MESRDRREFLLAAVTAAPVALLPFYPGVEAPTGTIIPPPIAPAVEEPALFFYVSLEETSDGERLLDEIATSPTEIAYHRKLACTSERKNQKYRRVQFVPLDEEERFAVCRTEWGAATPDFRVHEHDTPANEAGWQRYRQEQVNFPFPESLLDIPPTLEDHEDQWTQETFPLSREDALEMAADLNEQSIAEGLIKDGRTVRIEWYVVVELGRPIMRAFCDVEFDTNGFGVLKRETQWPLRLIRPTPAEVERFPVTAELLAKGGIVA